MSLAVRKLFTCNESDSFRPLRNTVERTRPKLNLIPDINEPENFITPAEYELSLRLTIQELKQLGQPKIQEVENILSFKQLIDPTLMPGYQKLIESIEVKTKISDEHPNREFIDLESKEIADPIEQWTEKLIGNIKIQRDGMNLSQDEIYELEALIWFHFDSLANLSNARSLELDIVEFYQSSNFYNLDPVEQVEKSSELLNGLMKKYPLKKDEIEILIALMTSRNNGKGLLETMLRLWKQYNLGERKGTIAKIVSSYLFSHLIQGITPFFFQYGIAYPTLGHVAGNGISAYCELLGELKEAELMNDIRAKINKRISDSMFFKTYEFTQTRSLGEIFKTIETGKESTIHLLTEAISQIFPQSVGIGTAFTGLMLINPILGLINLVSIPLTFVIGTIYNRKIRPIHKSELKEGEEVATQLADVKNGMQEILTSPNVPEIANSVKNKMDKKDNLSFQKILNEIKMRYAAYFTFNTTVGVSSGAGLLLYMLGKIPEGAVLSNVFYSEALSDPFKDLVKKCFTKFPRYIQDIERMEEILGEADKLDLPDGEREKERIPVSKLDNHHLSLKGLKFKNILNGVNLDINEGEFITIVGPSGVGKSTLLRNIAGLYKPDSGSIEIGGVNITDIKKYGDESIYSVMSYCNQEPQIFQEMTLRENLMLWSNKPTDDAYLNQMLENLYLDKFTDRLDEKINHFSGGEKVRLGVARTLIKGAKIILLDEPTASLDSEASLEVRKILRKIHKEYPKTTIICVTHDATLIEESLRLGRSINLGISNNAEAGQLEIAG